MAHRPKPPGRAPRAVLLDALGTTVALADPVAPLAAALGQPADATLRAAVREEMRFYRSHAVEAGDAGRLAALRERCAEIVARRIGRPVPVDALMSAIRFSAYDDAAPALARLRTAGLRIACVSNWDCGLGEVLEGTGLGAAFDVVVSSAEVGRAKPDPRPFEVALERLGVDARQAVHVGDTAEEDLAGARAAGIRALLIDRSGGGGEIASLAELPVALGIDSRRPGPGS